MIPNEPAVVALSAQYDRFLVPGGPPLGDPSPVPHGPIVEPPPDEFDHGGAMQPPAQFQLPGDVVLLDEGVAGLDGLNIALTEEDVKAIRLIVARRAAALFEEQLKAFKEKHALLKKG